MNLQAVARKAMRLWAPPPNLTVSEWADAERRLSPESSAEPGRYRTSTTEYAREMMDVFNDPKVKRSINMCSAQTGKSTIIENVIGYFSHHDPSPIMLVEPTLEIAEAFSKDRISPMVRDTPALRERFSAEGSKSSGNTLLHKKFTGGQLTIAGANSYNSLASRPIRIVLGDEAAKWKGNEQGSPFRQVSARTKAFWNSKEAYFSTPTSTENEFQAMWEESDKRIYTIPCPGCGANVALTFDELPASLPTTFEMARAVLRWTEAEPVRNDEGRQIRRSQDAWFECLVCGHHINEVERHRAVQVGQWVPTQEFYGTAGFWVWEGYSPFSTARHIADNWLSSLGDIAQTQSVKNETLGLPWKESGASMDWRRLFDRREHYTLGTVPVGALVLTAGSDVQPDRIEVQVIGWGRNREAWLIDYQIFHGETSRAEVWSQLTAFLGTVYVSADGSYELTIRKLCVDSGFAANDVYNWARNHKFGPVAVVKGGPDTQTALVSTPNPVEVNVRGKRIPSGVKVYTINAGEFKKELFGRLSLDAPNMERGEQAQAGYFHICELPDTEEYCRQLTAEQLVSRNVKGRVTRHWEKMRPRNEAMDTWDYAAAGRVMLGVDRWQDHHWAALESQLSPRQAQSEPIVRQAPRPALPQQPHQRMIIRLL